MTDSGSSQFPNRAPSVWQSILSQAGIDSRARITEVNGSLRDVKAPLKIEGEIVALNRDNSITIRTDLGELKVMLRLREIAREGQRLALEIPPGSPPKQAVVKPATPPPVQTAQISSPQAASQGATKPALEQNTQASLARQIETTAPQPRSATPQPLPPDSLVRLLAAPPDVAAQIIEQVTQLVQAKVTQQAQTTILSVQSDIAEELLKLIPSLPRQVVAQLAQQLATQILPRLPVQAGNYQPASPAPTTGGLPQQSAPVFDTALSALPAPLRLPAEGILRPLLTFAPLQAAPENQPLIASIRISGAFTATPDSAAGSIVKLPTLLSLLPAQASVQDTLQTMSASAMTTGKTALTTPPAAFSASRPPDFIDVRLAGMENNAFRILPVSPSGMPSKTITAPPSPLVLGQVPAQGMAAIVQGFTPQNLPLLSLYWPGQTEPENFILQFPASNLAPGSMVTIIPRAGMTPPLSSAAMPSIFELLTGMRWPALDDLAQFQMATQTQMMATSSLAQMLPSPAKPGQMPAAALFFIAAMRAGDMSGWLGEKTVDSLRRAGKTELLTRLGRDVNALNRFTTEPSTQEWRALPLPLYYEGEIHKLALYYRHGERDSSKDGKDNDGKKGSRFVLDLNLSRMGDVQLDGLARGKQLDLAVRTKEYLSEAMRMEMKRRYIHTLEVAGLTGELTFQSRPEQWVRINVAKNELSAEI